MDHDTFHPRIKKLEDAMAKVMHIIGKIAVHAGIDHEETLSPEQRIAKANGEPVEGVPQGGPVTRKEFEELQSHLKTLQARLDAGHVSVARAATPPGEPAADPLATAHADTPGGVLRAGADMTERQRVTGDPSMPTRDNNGDDLDGVDQPNQTGGAREAMAAENQAPRQGKAKA